MVTGASLGPREGPSAATETRGCREVELEIRVLLQLGDDLLHLSLPLLVDQRLSDAVLQRLEGRLRRNLPAGLQPVVELPLLRLGGLLDRGLLEALADVLLLRVGTVNPAFAASALTMRSIAICSSVCLRAWNILFS
jgi:hypothetical protein